MLDTDSQPISYDTVNREFKIYTDDENLIGTHDIKLNAHLETYP